MPQTPGTKRILWLILAVGLLIRLAIPFVLFRESRHDVRLPDEQGYLDIGRNLLSGKGFVWMDPRYDPPAGRATYAGRLPGYPIFVAMCGGSVHIVRIAQALLDTSTAIAAYLLARRFFSGRASLLAPALVALNPFLAFFTTLVLTETLFTAMLIWSLLFLITPTRRFLVIGLVLSGLSVLVRPSAILLPCALAAALPWLHQCSESRLRLGGRLVAGALLLIMCILMPWAMRNRAHPDLHQWIWTTTNSGWVQYDGFNPRANGESNQWFSSEMTELRTMREIEQSAFLTTLARQYIRENPIRAIELAFLKIRRTWSPMPLSDDYGRPLYRIVGSLYAVPLFALTLLGLVRANLPVQVKVFLLVPALYFTAVHALSVGSLRYRVPVEPALAVLAVGAIGRTRLTTEAVN